ncbi:MAG: SufD family Fe-S cluster assembly protein [Provencibacterium sp.]|jgi:Fe-S cluster assembly scaffold protein SufB|nr:SufD family Fe-S cluster assembly protein [Provencibacterium sp.]
MNRLTEELLSLISDYRPGGEFTGAYNIREDGGCAGRQSSENILITPKLGKPGIDILVKPGTKGETVYIPACVTHSGVDDLVYNDFVIGENAEVTIVAGCGVHTEGEEESRHNGIHHFRLERGARVLYLEKHIGIGMGSGARRIDPVTRIELGPDAYMEMDTTQIGGVDTTERATEAAVGEGAKLLIREKLLTEGEQTAHTDFKVMLDGEDSRADVVSRSVAKGQSSQSFRSVMCGNSRCAGHSECDAILMDGASVSAIPELSANHLDAALIHEAAIGKIAGEQLIKLMTLGLSEQQAEEKIIDGFLK